MQWWNDFLDWFYSTNGQRVLYGAIIPFVAIVVAGIVAALIARGALARLISRRDDELKGASVAALVNAARQASVWNSISAQEQVLADRAAGDADVQLRLLPIAGASVAANWAGHEIREFKRASATFSLQFDAPLAEFRDRLIAWQAHPRRTRKIFESDLARWTYENELSDKDLQAKQDAWEAEQRASAAASTSAPISARQAVSSPANQAASASTAPVSAIGTTPVKIAPATVEQPLVPVASETLPVRTVPEPVSRPTYSRIEAPAEEDSDLIDNSLDDNLADDFAPPVAASSVRRRNEDS